MFSSTHPGSTARSGRGYTNLGTSMNGDADDSVYRLCAQCGFPCKTDRDARGNSEESPGLQQVTTVVTIPGGTKNVIEMNVVSGCPFCGSHNYEGNHKLRGSRNTSTQRR